MSKILLVDIDAHSKHNTACFIDQEGNIVLKSFSFPDNLSGATELEQKIVNVMQKAGFTSLKVATESASLYDIHLLDFLVASEHLVLFSLKSNNLILKSPVDLRKFIRMRIKLIIEIPLSLPIDSVLEDFLLLTLNTRIIFLFDV